MPQTVNLKIAGLYTAPNDFSGAPEGALDVADDIVIDQKNLAEPRRGFRELAHALPLPSDRLIRWAYYEGRKLGRWSGDKMGYYDDTLGWQAYTGSYSNPDDIWARSRFFSASKNIFVLTGSGTYVIDDPVSDPVLAGMPRGLDLQVSLTGSSGFLTPNIAVTTTAKTTSGSPTLTTLGTTSGIFVGQIIAGSGIVSGTTVQSITSSSTVLQTTGTTTAGSTSVTAIPSNAGLAVGQLVSGTGIASGTRVSAISGAGPYTVTLTQNAIASGTSVAISFASDPTITMSQNATASATVSLDFSEGSQVGYRGLFLRQDANENLIYGAPTQFATVINDTGGTRNVIARFTIPSGIKVGWSYQLYRTDPTPSLSLVPTDEESLVYTGTVTNSDLSNGYIEITDQLPESLKGQALYTNASQQGILQANNQPPLAWDACTFRNFTFYANCRTKQRKKLTVVSVGGTSGIALNDTLTIAGVTYTAKASESIASAQFELVTSGTPAQNIADTVDSLIRVINRYSGNTAVNAYLLSGPTDLPGQILLEERGVGGSTFALTASAHSTAYNPELPTSGTSVSSAQDVYRNGIIIAKEGEPGAAPEANLVFAGSANADILRVIPLREYIAILTTEGIFRLTGTDLSSFQVAPFDLTTRLVAPDTATAFANEVWCYADQGVVSISDTGVNVRSLPIDDVVRNLLSQSPNSIRQVAFAVGYETDRRYVLSLPTTDDDTFTNQQYCFQLFTDSWVRWTRKATAGFIHPEEKVLYFGNGQDSTVSVERKTGSFTDYADEGVDVSITSSSGKSVVLNTVENVQVGDILYQSSTQFSLITSVDEPTLTVTVNDTVAWSVASAEALKRIEGTVQWKPIVSNNPAYLRQSSQGNILFKSQRFSQATLSFYSDLSQAFEDVPVAGFPLGLWGQFPFGSVPWGGVNRPRTTRFHVPKNKQFNSQLSVRLEIFEAFSAWSLEGLSISYYDISEEVS